MTLEQLRIFVAVAERAHVTRAASDLNLTQSAVSSAISALEARHAVQLFDRVGRGVVLNEMGQAFLAEARGVLARAATAEAALNDMAALRRGRLSIHASQTIASYWLPQRLVAFHAAHPGVELNVTVGNTREVAKAVTNGEAELGYVEGQIDSPLLSREDVGSDRLAILVCATHPWAERQKLSLADLRAAAWVLREEGSGTRSSLEAALGVGGGRDLGLTVVMTLPSNEAVMAAAIAGAGATALSENVAAAALAAGDLVRAPFPLPARTYSLLRHKERYRTRAGEVFAQIARESKPADAKAGRPRRDGI